MQLGVLFGSQLLGGGMFMRMAVMGASVAGSLLLKDKSKPNPQKLNDLRVSSATYGRGIPIAYGTMRVTGNCFWSTEFREDRYFMTSKGKRVDGKKGEKKEKKGKAQEMYDYYANYAMGLCAGPVDSILRIWADNNLIYNKLNPNDEDIVGPGFSQSSGSTKSGPKSSTGKGKGRGGASSRFTFRFYRGNEEQQPDHYMAARTGVDKSPGYRGLAYLMFEEFPLKDFGNRIPTITAEVSVIEHRRPMVEVIENMEPKLGFSNKVLPPVHFDPVRNRIYQEARMDGRRLIRVFDVTQKKEVRRLDTTEIHGNWIGMTHKGDLVFNRSTQNVSPTDFYDPDTLTRIASFGRSAIWGGPDEGIFGARFAIPVMGTDDMMEPVGYTCVHGWDGIHNFDDNYDVKTFTTGSFAGMESKLLKRVTMGAPGGETATGHPAGAFAISSNTYALTEQVYAFDPNRIGVSGIPMLMAGTMERVFQWPPADWTEAIPGGGGAFNGLQYGGIAWAGAVLGARNLGVLAWWTGAAPEHNGLWAIKVDYQTGEEVWRKRVSTDFGDGPSGGFMTPNATTTFQLTWLTGRTLWTVNWQEEKVSTIQVGASLGDGNRLWVPSESYGEYYLGNLDAILYFTNDGRVNDGEGNWVLLYLDRKIQGKVYVSDIVRDVAIRCGIPADRIDTSGLTQDEEVTGFMVENPTPGRSVLEELSDVFQFDCVESDHILKFVSRGKPPVRTIPQDHLGVVQSDFGGENEYYVETRMQETDLPERCVVEFVDPEQKYETGSQGYKRPSRPLSVMGSHERLDVTLNMAMKPQRAKSLAQRILYAAWGERTQHEYVLPRDYLMLDPSDVIEVELENGVTFLDRLTDLETGADLSIKAQTVSQYADSYNLDAIIGESGGEIQLPYTPPPNAKAGIFDIPYLFDNDADHRAGFYEFYWAALAYGNGFRGGALSSRLEDSDDTEMEGVSRLDALWGFCLTYPIPAPPSGITEITDEETVLHLQPAYDWNDGEEPRYSWETIPDEQWPSTDNMVIIGNEVILFKNVEELEDGTVQISHLIRGYRGTGNAAFEHPNVEYETGTNSYGGLEEFVLVHPMTVHDADHEMADVNRSRRYSLAAGHWLPAYLTANTHTTTGATRKPWQVGGLKRRNLSNGSVEISFSRSTRYGGDMLSGTGAVPLNEAFEKYEVFWLNDPFDRETWDPENPSLYWRKDELTDISTITVPAAELSTAGKTNTMDFHFVFYQVSDQIGRGFPRGVTIPYSMFGL